MVAFTTALSFRRDPEPKRAGLVAAIIFLALTAIIGLPTLGANVGGAVAAAATGVILTLLLRGDKLGGRHVVLVVITMALVIAGILLVDYLSSSKSHAARAASLATRGGAGQAWLITSRKLATNFRLLAHSSWTNILVAAAITAIALKLGAARALETVSRSYPWMVVGLKTIVLGSIAALILNDSGVVMAAIMVLFAVFSWLYLIIDAAQTNAPPAH